MSQLLAPVWLDLDQAKVKKAASIDTVLMPTAGIERWDEASFESEVRGHPCTWQSVMYLCKLKTPVPGKLGHGLPKCVNRGFDVTGKDKNGANRSYFHIGPF